MCSITRAASIDVAQRERVKREREGESAKLTVTKSNKTKFDVRCSDDISMQINASSAISLADCATKLTCIIKLYPSLFVY